LAAPYVVNTPEPSQIESRPMAVEEVRSAAHRLITDAQSYDDEHLAPKRAKATKYYQGKPFGNEEEGRSQVILTDLRDTVRAIMPSLVRVFFGAEQAVEYQPHGAEDVEAAEQATDYVNSVVLSQDNPGFLIFHSWFKDALVRNIGVVKYWWEDATEIQAHQAICSTEQLELLASDPDVELSTISESGLATPGEPSYQVEFRHTRKDGRARYECLPPNEFLRSRDARSLQHASLVAHRTVKTSSELMAMGIPEAVIKEHGGLDGNQDSEEEQARRGGAVAADESVDWASEKHTYTEAYPYLDVDGDKYAELRKLCCLGPSAYVVNGDGRGEPWDERPFALLIPDPEPHTLDGQGPSDWTMDLQIWGSSVVRAINDSLSLSIYPRVAYKEGEVNVEDVLTTKIGAPIRTYQQPDLVLKSFSHEFAGAKAFPMLEVIESIRQNRTGISKAAAGLDADALQSSTKAAVAATVTAAQQHIEMIARIFAETGVKDLFKGLLKLLHAHQPKARMVRLRKKYVEVDPRAWDAQMDVSVNVALGAGLVEEKLAVLGAIAEDQKEILTALGPSNPLVTYGMYRNTRAKMAELAGFKDVAQFYAEIPLDWRPPPAPPQPDPNMLIAQAEMAKAEADVAKKQADVARSALELQQKQGMLEVQAAAKREELALQEREMLLRDDRERDKLEADIALRAREIEAQNATTVDVASIQAQVDRDRAKIDADAKVDAAKEDAKAKKEAAKESVTRDEKGKK
jgi:hypothetical protein